MIRVIFLTFLLFCAFVSCFHTQAQKSSIVLGYLHYDLLHDHDMDWLSTKAGDFRQVTEEYTKHTSENWNDFMSLLKKKVISSAPPAMGMPSSGLTINGALSEWIIMLSLVKNRMIPLT